MKIVPQETSPQEASRWLKGRFVIRSGFYAGRPPSQGDLNSEILEMFYKGIKKDVGKEEAKNFVCFVNKLKDLSASSFVVAFERFWSDGCKNTRIRKEKGDRTMLSARGDGLIGEAFGMLGSMMGSQMSESQIEAVSASIKHRFIQDHFSEIPEEERQERLDGRHSRSPVNGFY